MTRSFIEPGSWQSMHATARFRCLRASMYGSLLSASKPAIMSPPPSSLYTVTTDAWQLAHVPGWPTAWRSVNVWSSSM